MKRLIPLLSFLLICNTLLPGEDIWEGNAAVIRRGEFEIPGMFAATNAFPKDSRILVENLQNGKQVQVTVVKRIDGPQNIFLLLSENAAETINLAATDVIRVRASILASSELSSAALPEDLPFNPDPDINPQAEIATMEKYFSAQRIAGGPQTTGPDIDRPEPSSASDGSTVEAETPLPRITETEGGPSRSTEEQLKKLANRTPQKQLFMPPREDERFALARPLPEQEAGEQQPLVSMSSPSQQQHPLAVALPDPEGPEAERPDLAPPAEPRDEPLKEIEPDLPRYEEQTVVTLEPTGPRPPGTDQDQVFLVEALEAKAYFLQLGAFGTLSRAEQLARDLKPTYTVAVQPVALEKQTMYKVLIGPLNDDESGTLLYRFRTQGFRDAFIKYID